MASTAINHDNSYMIPSVISFSACLQRISNVDSDTHNTNTFKFQIQYYSKSDAKRERNKKGNFV